MGFKSGYFQQSIFNRLFFQPSPTKVVRKATGTVLFDTSLGGLIFSDQFIQISTKQVVDLF